MKMKTRLYYLLRSKLVFKNYLKYYRQAWKLGKDNTDQILVKILDHCRKNVPYYQDKLGEVQSCQDINNIPILYKKNVREEFESLKSLDLDQRNHYSTSSGGSTGKPVTFLQDLDYNEWLLATENYYYKKYLGFEYADTTKVILWGSHRDARNLSNFKSKLGQYLSSTHFVDAFDISQDVLGNYVDCINSVKPRFLRSQAGSLYLLACYIKQNNLKVFLPEFIVTSAETLRDFMRDTIEEVFECHVHDYYGSREVGIIAAECQKGKMHTLPFFNLVEVVDESGNSVKSGEEGRILITNLRNYSMPLIRYEIGDTGILGSDCLCGNPGPVLDRVTGRVTDHFIKRDNTLVHGQYFTRLFYHNSWVGEFQILQRELDLIEIHYIPVKEESSEEMGSVETKIKDKMGADCKVDWIKTDTIPRTPEGKRLYTRSLVKLDDQVLFSSLNS